VKPVLPAGALFGEIAEMEGALTGLGGAGGVICFIAPQPVKTNSNDKRPRPRIDDLRRTTRNEKVA